MDLKSLRKSIIQKRECLSFSQLKDTSDKIVKTLFSLDGFVGFDSYFVYRSFRGEVDTGEIIKRLQSLDKTLVYPLTTQDEMFAVKNEGAEFVKDKFGVEIPSKYSIFDSPDVVIVPLVACDENLNRVGFGKGYYDKFLKGKNCLKIGICHDFQVVEKIEPNEWDIPLDIIITEKRIIRR